MTDALFYIANLNVKFSEIVEDNSVEDERTAEEIIEHIKSKVNEIKEG